MLQLQVIGNLGSDAQTKEINGKSYLTFRVASTAKRGGKEETTWVSVMHYNNPNLLQYLIKGASVFVSGDGRISTYTNKDGITSVDVTVWANTLQLVGKKASNDTQSQSWNDITRIEMQRAQQAKDTDELPFT